MTPQAVCLDLDDTLYDQAQYVGGALARVAASVAAEGAGRGADLAASLLATWRRLGPDHARLFDTWLASHGLGSRRLVPKCVRVFHAHRPGTLTPYRGVRTTLRALRARYRLALVTDGEPRAQRAKIAALGLEGAFDAVVCAGDLGRAKPDPTIFECALRALALPPAEAVFVGDHPVRDVAGARRVGMRAIRVLTGPFRPLADDPDWGPDDRIRTLHALPAALERLAGQEQREGAAAAAAGR